MHALIAHAFQLAGIAAGVLAAFDLGVVVGLAIGGHDQ